MVDSPELGKALIEATLAEDLFNMLAEHFIQLVAKFQSHDPVLIHAGVGQPTGDRLEDQIEVLGCFFLFPQAC